MTESPTFQPPRIVGTIRYRPIEIRRVEESILFVPLDPQEAVEIEKINGQRLQIKYQISYVGYPSYETFHIQTLAPDRRVLWERSVELPNMGHSIFDLGDGFVMLPYGGSAKTPCPKDSPSAVGWMIRPLVSIAEPILQRNKPAQEFPRLSSAGLRGAAQEGRRQLRG